MRVCFAAPSMVGEVVCVFWKAVVGVFWVLAAGVWLVCFLVRGFKQSSVVFFLALL